MASISISHSAHDSPLPQSQSIDKIHYFFVDEDTLMPAMSPSRCELGSWNDGVHQGTQKEIRKSGTAKTSLAVSLACSFRLEIIHISRPTGPKVARPGICINEEFRTRRWATRDKFRFFNHPVTCFWYCSTQNRVVQKDLSPRGVSCKLGSL